MKTTKCEVITPEKDFYNDDADFIVAPGASGELGILPMHIPLMTELKPGELKITQKGVETFMAVGSGFVEVTQDHVSVLTDMALEENEINEATAEEAIARAQEALRNGLVGGEDVATVEANLAKSIAQLQVKRRKHH